MRTHDTDDVPDDDTLPTTPEDADRAASIAAEIVLAGDRPAECTLFPTDVSETAITTTWITASEGSFVSLEAMR